METTAEIHWFWQKETAAALGRWFIDSDIHGCDAVGGDVRTNAYLKDAGQPALGVKRRGTRRGS